MHTDSPIFTPENEPYLGREPLVAFDKLIVAVLDLNRSIAPHTHNINKSELQVAACQLIPSAISLSLSIRELIRQGYLYGALVLVRPLAERTAILQWLSEDPTRCTLWSQGWKHGERPTLARMLDDIAKSMEGESDLPQGVGWQITKMLNSLTHGDPDSAIWNMVEMADGKVGYSVSKILDRSDLCDKASVEATGWLGVLLSLMITVFPEYENAI